MTRSARRSGDDANRAHEHTFEEPSAPDAVSERVQLDDLAAVPLQVSAVLGHAEMLVREVLELKRGTVLPLEKLAGEMTDMHINGVPFARGEVVVLGDTLHVRIAEINGAPERTA